MTMYTLSRHQYGIMRDDAEGGGGWGGGGSIMVKNSVT